MPHPDVSVILCTHNPRVDYLERALAGLRGQTLPHERWELLLIDNASESSVGGRFDIEWHPGGRHIREDELGLTPARLRGIADASAELLIFVDDDNVLSPDYLELALQVGTACSFLGTWGGQCVPEFEIEPAPELRQYLPRLALRTTDRDSWTNVAGDWSEAYPYGAGFCVRRKVAGEFALGRRGTLLFSGDDYDVNLTACDMGLGCGVFQFLKLTHLISSRRLTVEYMLKLSYGHSYSSALLFTERGKPPHDPLPNRLKRLFWKARLRRYPYPERAFVWAELLGMHDGIQYCQRTNAAARQSAGPHELSGLHREHLVLT
jgi:glycosyltransferase involved in cell wall biosynthesis